MLLVHSYIARAYQKILLSKYSTILTDEIPSSKRRQAMYTVKCILCTYLLVFASMTKCSASSQRGYFKMVKGMKLSGTDAQTSFKAENERFCSISCLAAKNNTIGFNYNIFTKFCYCFIPSMYTSLLPRPDVEFVYAWQVKY